METWDKNMEKPATNMRSTQFLSRLLTLVLGIVLAAPLGCADSEVVVQENPPWTDAQDIRVSPNESYNVVVLQRAPEADYTATEEHYRESIGFDGRTTPFHGIQGIRFDSDDNLWICSCLGHSITSMDPETGQVQKVFGIAETGETDDFGDPIFEGIMGPDDLVFKDGWIWYTAIMTNEVWRLDPESAETELVATGIAGADSIALNGEGRLFVGGCFLGGGLWEIRIDGPTDPATGHEVRTVVTPRNPVPLGDPQSYYNFNAFDFDPNNPRIAYLPMYHDNKVVRIDVGEPGDPAVTFDRSDPTFTVVEGLDPIAVRFDPQDARYLYVLDWRNGNVWRVDTENSATDINEKGELVVTLEHGLDNLTFDSSGDLYISNHYGAIYHVSAGSGSYRMVRERTLNMPGGIDVISETHGDQTNDILVVGDMFNTRELDARTGEVTSCDLNALDYFPQEVSVSDDGYVASVSKGTFQVRVNRRGVFVHGEIDANVGSPYPPEMPSLPVSVVWYQGDLIVADLMRGLLRWELDETRSTIVSQTVLVPSRDGGLPRLWSSLAMTEDDGSGEPALYATETNDPFSAYDPSSAGPAGKVWKIHPDSGGLELVVNDLGDGSLHGPEGYPTGIAVDVDGSQLVVQNRVRETDTQGVLHIYGNLLRIDTGSPETVSVVAEGFSTGLPIYMPALKELHGTKCSMFAPDVAVSESGTIYITGAYEAEIIALVP